MTLLNRWTTVVLLAVSTWHVVTRDLHVRLLPEEVWISHQMKRSCARVGQAFFYVISQSLISPTCPWELCILRWTLSIYILTPRHDCTPGQWYESLLLFLTCDVKEVFLTEEPVIWPCTPVVLRSSEPQLFTLHSKDPHFETRRRHKQASVIKTI